MGKTLHLNLKRKWFDMILSGEKKEEYREIKDYWVKRLTQSDNDFKDEAERLKKGEFHQDNLPYGEKIQFRYSYCFPKDINKIIFSNGYSKDRDQFTIEFNGILIKEGIPKWGAKSGEKYFVIQLGKILDKNN